MVFYVSSIILFLVGIYCVSVKKNLIKIVIGLIIMEYALNLFIVTVGYRGNSVDPQPQVMALTLITVGLATTIILTAIAMRIYQRYGTFDITEMRKLKG